MRSFSNMNGHNPGDTVATLPTDIFGSGKFIENDPTAGTHPAGTGFSYTIAAATTIPVVGTLYLTASDPEYAPATGSTDDW